MKILQVINSLATGGAEKLLSESLPVYRSKGIAMDVLVLNGSAYPFQQALTAQHAVAIHSLGKGSVYNPFHVFKIMKYLKQCDLVHVHLFPSLYWVALAKWLSFSKTKLIFTEHSTSNKRRDKWLWRQLDRWVYSKYEIIVCITNEVREKIKAHLAVSGEKLVVIENGIDLSKVMQAKGYAKAALQLPEAASVLIQVASFKPPKDQLTVIRSMQNLPETVHLLLVGEGPLLEEAQSEAQKRGVANRVHFLGIRMDVPQLLKTADIIILSSRYEGLSLSCLEGMASGRPFVATEVPGLKELVGGSGVLFPYGDEVKLAEIVNNLLSDPSKYDAVSQKCVTKAMQFDCEKMIEKHIGLYQSLRR